MGVGSRVREGVAVDNVPVSVGTNVIVELDVGVGVFVGRTNTMAVAVT